MGLSLSLPFWARPKKTNLYTWRWEQRSGGDGRFPKNSRNIEKQVSECSWSIKRTNSYKKEGCDHPNIVNIANKRGTNWSGGWIFTVRTLKLWLELYIPEFRPMMVAKEYESYDGSKPLNPSKSILYKSSTHFRVWISKFHSFFASPGCHCLEAMSYLHWMHIQAIFGWYHLTPMNLWIYGFIPIVPRRLDNGKIYHVKNHIVSFYSHLYFIYFFLKFAWG